MNQLLIAAKEICDFLSDQGWKHCVIGGLAVQRWGESRTMLYIDITLLVGFGRESEYVHALLGRFPSRIDDARNFALEQTCFCCAPPT
jgi:hypothetical protein